MSETVPNAFREDICARLDVQERYLSQAPCSYDAVRGAWVQPTQRGRCSAPVLLAGRGLAVDVTDRGMALYPLGALGRFHVRVAAHRGAGGTPEPSGTHREEVGRETGRVLTLPGAAVVEAPGATSTVRVWADSPVTEVTLTGLSPGTHAVVHWYAAAGHAVPVPLSGGAFVRPATFSQDPVVERNNSSVPDPLPAARGTAPGLALVVVPTAGGHDGEVPVCDCDHEPDARPVLLVDRLYGVADCQHLHLPGTADEEGRLVVLVAVGRDPGTALALLSGLGPGGAGRDPWPAVLTRLQVLTGQEPIDRQLPFSLHNSLFSRARTDGGREIFVHGRRDRGYADAAHLHQSFQMHLPALASGEGASVRDEILAFLALQRADGWLEAAPRPGGGWSRYVGRYTGSHLLLAVERYLSWTGDTVLMAEEVHGLVDGLQDTVLQRIRRVVSDLLAHRSRGLSRPCGWADAWNPSVVAQGQASLAAVAGLRAWAAVCDHLGLDVDAAAARREAAAVQRSVCDLLHDQETGLVAEHLFPDGPAGSSPDDFWAHTQVWARLTDVVTDDRGLDAARDACLDHGLAVAPQSALERQYVVSSTDSDTDLPVESTATWLLARWPELTHLYALARLRSTAPGAASDAEAAVLGQLPESLHALDSRCPPSWYAEKYLSPGPRPWLCTWAGDPSLIEVVLTGFLGVRSSVDGLRLRPRLPPAWGLDRPVTARFSWRGQPHHLRLVRSADQEPSRLWVDGALHPLTDALGPPTGPRTLLYEL